MKKHILLCVICFGVYGLSHAQFYIKGFTGYAFATGNERLNSEQSFSASGRAPDGSWVNINERYAYSYRLKFGQGVNLGLSVGYAFNQNIAFEITGNTQLFSTFNHSNPYHSFDFREWKGFDWNTVSFSMSSSGFFGDLEYSNRLFQFSPQVVFRSNPINQWTFYLKGGPNFMWVKQTTTVHDVREFFRFSTTSWDWERQREYILQTSEWLGGISTGIQCSFGIEYELSRNIGLFAELTTVHTNYTFNRGEILRHERNGVDYLHALRETVFEDLDMKMSFNHIALNIGIKYTFR